VDLAWAIQVAVTAALAVSFYAFAWISSPHDWIGLLAATLAFAIVPVILDQLGDIEPSAQEPGIVMIGAVAVLALVVPPVTTVRGLALGSGALAIQAFWALRRYPPLHDDFEPVAGRIRSSLRFAIRMAIALTVLAVAIPAISSSGNHPGSQLLLEAAVGTVVGAVAAAALVGVLRPLSQWPLGTMLLGLLAGPLAFGAMIPVLFVVEGKPLMSLHAHIWISLFSGVLVGPAVALSMKYKRIGGPRRAA